MKIAKTNRLTKISVNTMKNIITTILWMIFGFYVINNLEVIGKTENDCDLFCDTQQEYNLPIEEI